MKRQKTATQRLDGTVGYAANERGSGVAYIRSTKGLMRVPFRCKRVAGLDGREVGYAALRAVLHALRTWGVNRVRLAVDDARLVEELAERRDVPAPMVLPYVRLRCALNEFDHATVERGASPDELGVTELTQRAQAEAALLDAA